jgi:metal-responsive CopG/Arc/MetJ family transcriptional regulator
MRVHISLDDDLIRRLDARVGSRARSSFIAEAVRAALDDEDRWTLIQSSIGAIQASGHDWDGDAAGWVRAQRRTDERRVG